MGLASAALVVTALLTGCGPREIKDIPPVVQLQQMRLAANEVRLALRIDNANDIAISGGRLRFTMNLEGQAFASHQGALELNITPHSAEVVPVSVVPTAEGMQRLQRLLAESKRGLGWSMGGDLKLDQSLDSEFAARGRCFEVPGERRVLRCTASVSDGRNARSPRDDPFPAPFERGGAP